MGKRVYFDYVADKGQGVIIMGVLIYEEGEQLLPLQVKKAPYQGEYKNLEHSTEAFGYAIDLAKQNFIEEVTFINQNNVVFDWMLKPNEREVVTKVQNKLDSYLNHEDIQPNANFTKVKRSENMVSKQLKGYKPKKDTTHEGNFNELFNREQLVKRQEKANKRNKQNKYQPTNEISGKRVVITEEKESALTHINRNKFNRRYQAKK